MFEKNVDLRCNLVGVSEATSVDDGSEAYRILALAKPSLL
jgi:hypothetical protein